MSSGGRGHQQKRPGGRCTGERKGAKDHQPTPSRGGGGGCADPALALWDFQQCDPTKCSGQRLVRLGLVRAMNVRQSFPGIVLTPTATQVLSPADIGIVQRFGIATVDCSWKELGGVSWQKMSMGHPRLLPFCVAGNPVNYGRPYKLNCAEAYCMALAVVGMREFALRLIMNFRYGEAFWNVNAELIATYAACADAEQVQAAQEQYLSRHAEEANARRRQSSAPTENDDEDEERIVPLNKKQGRAKPLWQQLLDEAQDSNDSSDSCESEGNGSDTSGHDEPARQSTDSEDPEGLPVSKRDTMNQQERSEFAETPEPR